MKNIQRGIRVLTLIALFMMSVAIFAQEATEEATAEATEMVEEMTEEPMAESTDMVEEATAEAEMTEAAAEVTDEPAATAAPEITPEVTVEAMPVIEEVAGSVANIVGSGVVNPALESVVNASGSIATYNFTNTGSSAGFEQFCAGGAEITTAIRPITVEEDTACREAGVEYLELRVGYDIMVVVSNIEDDFLACMTAANLNQVFAPSATATSWEDIDLAEPVPDPLTPATATPDAEVTPEATEEPFVYPNLTVLLPQDTSLTYEVLDIVVSGFGFRADAQQLDAASIVATVESTPGAIGVVPLEAALAPDANVFLVGLNFNGVNCEQPSVVSVEAGTYPAATPLYLYVATRAQDSLAFFLDFLTSNASIQPLIDAGYTPASPEVYELNAAIVSGEASSRATTAEAITFNIPPNLTGNVSIVGASSGFSIANGNTVRLTSTQQTLTIENNFAGETAGIEEFCNGSADILFVNGDSSAVCDGAVEFVSYDFGYQSVVLVANAGDSYATCLTLEQVSNIWSATSTETVTQWSNVSDAFPETPLTLLGTNIGNVLTDVLISSVTEGVPPPIRIDVAETNSDALYRSAAVANVSGALTYMSWSEYEEVLANGQANTQLVAIDTGSGCVVPSVEAITDGSYPITRQTTMLVKQSSLANIQVQSFVWSVFSDANFSIIEVLDLVGGFQTQDIVEFRTDLLAQFEAATQAQLAAEVTPEVTAEATAEATTEASGE